MPSSRIGPRAAGFALLVTAALLGTGVFANEDPAPVRRVREVQLANGQVRFVGRLRSGPTRKGGARWEIELEGDEGDGLSVSWTGRPVLGRLVAKADEILATGHLRDGVLFAERIDVACETKYAETDCQRLLATHGD